MSEGTETRKERNIMILFLSDFKFQDAPKKVQNSVDGNVVDGRPIKGEEVKILSDKFKSKPILHDGRKDILECFHTNDAPIRDVLTYLKETYKSTLDEIFYFCTSKLQKKESICLWEDDKIHWYNSQEELFQNRIKKLCDPYLNDTQFIAVPFETEGETPSMQMQRCIDAVVDMEEKITKDMTQNEMQECHLFADITGGLRTANMAMTAVRQLLQYKRIHLDLVLYSDGAMVSDVRDIDNLYTLVAGLEAFTNYGRSDTIEKYFGFNFEKKENDNSKTKLESLLVAMHHFADAMSLCWPDYIIKALNDLIDSLDKYPPDSSDPKEKLLIHLLPTIREKYDSLSFNKGQKREIDRLAVIKWCIENNLIQPALTFCTEWLPEYLVDYGVVYSDDPAVHRYCKGRDKNGDANTNGKKYFIMDFFTKQPTENVEKKKNALKIISNIGAKIIIDALIDNKGVEDKESQMKTGILPSYLRSVPQKLNNAKNGTMNLKTEELTDKQDKLFVNTLKSIAKSRNLKFCRKTVMKITDNDVFNQMKLNSLDYYCENYDVGSLRMYPYQVVSLPDDMDISEKSREICSALLRCGMVKTIFVSPSKEPLFEQATDYIQRYTNIRANIRNTSLHAANAMGTKKLIPQTFTEVKKELKDCLQLMVKLVNDERAKKHIAKNIWPNASKKEEATP